MEVFFEDGLGESALGYTDIMVRMMCDAETNELGRFGFVCELVFGAEVMDNVLIGGGGAGTYEEIVNNNGHTCGGTIGFGAGV